MSMISKNLPEFKKNIQNMTLIEVLKHKRSALDRVLKFYGSQVNLAKALGITRAAVGLWVKAGAMPESSAVRLEAKHYRWTCSSHVSEIPFFYTRPDLYFHKNKSNLFDISEEISPALFSKKGVKNLTLIEVEAQKYVMTKELAVEFGNKEMANFLTITEKTVEIFLKNGEIPKSTAIYLNFHVKTIDKFPLFRTRPDIFFKENPGE